VLTSFTLPQLEAQLAGLRVLVKESQGHLEQVRKAERLQRAQLQKLTHAKHAKRKADASSDLCQGGEHVESREKESSVTTGPTAHAASGEEAQEKDHEECDAEELSAGAQLGKQRRRTLRKQIERLEARIKALKVEQSSAEKSMQGVEESGERFGSEAADGQYNPKTRGGWGFWKT